MTQNKRKAKYIGTSLQKNVLYLVFLAAIVPAFILGAALYYLIFNMLAEQLGIPEAIAYNLLPVVQKVNLIIVIVLPISILFIWFLALELSHRIAGPLFRLEKDLDEVISGSKKEHIKIRQKDELRPLVERINKLINR
jgi:hypothetical protein